jgi:hypothetical protein
MIKSNAHAVELYNTVNELEPAKGSHQELAQARTLRNMKEWVTKHNEKLQDIRDSNCATKDVDGAKILLKKTLKRTIKNLKGEETTEEFQVNEYTPDGLKQITTDTNNYLIQKPVVTFDVHSTYDESGLTAYQKEVLTEYGFLITKEEFEKKTAKKTGSEKPV